MANTRGVAAKRKRKLLDVNKAKKAAKPALFNVAGAVGGGLLGAVTPPMVSGPGGLVLIFAGAYSEQSWLTSIGTGMLVSTTCTAATNPNLRTASGEGIDTETEVHNAKERAKTFFTDLADKFMLWKKKDEAGSVAGLGSAEAIAQLDAIEQQGLASGQDYASQNSLPSPDIQDLQMAESQEVNGFINM